VDASSDNNQPDKQPRPRLDEIMPAAKSAALSRAPFLNGSEAPWFEPVAHPGMSGFWSFLK
jgi:hypothetical protein